MKKRRTQEEIERIYWLKTEGKSIKGIAEEMGIGSSTVCSTLRSLKSYLDTGKFNAKRRRNRSYIRAMKRIKVETQRRGENAHSAVSKFCEAVEGVEKRPRKVEVVEETKVLQNEKREGQDRFDKLEQSLSAFQQSISQFIEEEVENQVGSIKSENSELKVELKKAYSELEPLKEEAHRSNWVGELKRKFGADHVTSL